MCLKVFCPCFKPDREPYDDIHHSEQQHDHKHNQRPLIDKTHPPVEHPQHNGKQSADPSKPVLGASRPAADLHPIKDPSKEGDKKIDESSTTAGDGPLIGYESDKRQNFGVHQDYGGDGPNGNSDTDTRRNDTRREKNYDTASYVDGKQQKKNDAKKNGSVISDTTRFDGIQQKEFGKTSYATTQVDEYRAEKLATKSDSDQAKYDEGDDHDDDEDDEKINSKGVAAKKDKWFKGLK